MKKKSGFTLIELLAVIVILAIILLIATPIVLNVIEDAKKGSFKNSASYLMKTAENKYLTNALKGTTEDLVYEYVNGKAVGGVDLDYKGETPKSGTIVIKQDGKIGIAIDNGKWCAIKNYNEDAVRLIKLEEDNCKLSEVPEEPVLNEFDETKGVNKPVLTEGMTPIKWDSSNVESDTTENDSEWYDYTNKKWANAKTADGSYWVWIPRYAYSISSGYHTSTAGTIDIKFLKGITNIASDDSAVETVPTYSGSSQTNYIKHSAFTFGEEETLGYWVAKFEPSGSASNINIVPNVSSLRSVKIGDQFDAAYNMRSNSKYGWSTSTVETYMMKNSEWGAVAYLSKSIYGANAEVWINPNQNYITGCAGTSVSAGSTTSCQAYNTTNGMLASTTHNITGIYDMSGGAFEYVSSYVNNGHGSLTTYGNNILSRPTKYKDIYVSGSGDTRANNYTANQNKYGDAVYETSLNGDSNNSSWYGDYSYMPYSTNPWFIRGGLYYDGSSAGVFSFLSDSGNASSSYSFRPVARPIA